MSGLVVLNFHGIGTPGREMEPGEAPYWVGTDQFGAILDRIVAHPDRARIRITFDDGNISDRTVALPALTARGLAADFFVLSGRIGRPGSLGADDIAALLEAGMGIGSHGVAHLDWSALEPAALEAELAGSRARLEAVCRCPVRSAAIPFGRWSGGVLRGLRAAGYGTAWSSDGGMSWPGDFPAARTSVRGAMGMDEIDMILAGRMGPARRARRALGLARKRWLA